MSVAHLRKSLTRLGLSVVPLRMSVAQLGKSMQKRNEFSKIGTSEAHKGMSCSTKEKEKCCTPKVECSSFQKEIGKNRVSKAQSKINDSQLVHNWKRKQRLGF